MSYSQGQDWNTLGWNKSRPGGRIGNESKEQALNRARRAGNIGTEQRHNGGMNKSAHSNGGGNMKKLEEDSENFKHNKVDASLSKSIQQARLAKNMTQKALATAINEKPQIIGEYESGKAIPNGQLIVKMERALGVKLPRGKKKTAKN